MSGYFMFQPNPAPRNRAEFRDMSRAARGTKSALLIDRGNGQFAAITQGEIAPVNREFYFKWSKRHVSARALNAAGDARRRLRLKMGARQLVKLAREKRRAMERETRGAIRIRLEGWSHGHCAGWAWRADPDAPDSSWICESECEEFRIYVSARTMAARIEQAKGDARPPVICYE